jgi:hypothetical protein
MYIYLFNSNNKMHAVCIREVYIYDAVAMTNLKSFSLITAIRLTGSKCLYRL